MKSEQSASSSPISYGKELWDCLSIIEKNNDDRIKTMQSLLSFLGALQLGIEAFSSSLDKALKTFKQSMSTRMTTTEGKVLVSTLDTTIDNVLFKTEEIVQGLR